MIRFRAMRRRALVVVLVALAAVAVGPTAGSAHAGEPGGDEKVVVVTAPGLTWDDLVEHDLPTLERFLSDATVAMLSLRTIGARTSTAEGYATFGAGNRASAGTSAAGLALEPDEWFEEGTAAQTYERRTGRAGTGALLHLGFPAIERLNDRFLYGAEPGALGQAMLDAGRSVGVVANADLGVGPPLEDAPIEFRFGNADYGRTAALTVMDRTGQVPHGTAVGLLDRVALAPYGVRYDNDAVAEEFAQAHAEADLTVVELSDLDRADRYRSEASRLAAERMWVDALTSSDDLFGQLLGLVDEGTTVMVMTPASPRGAESLGVFALSEAGMDDGGNLARSAATRRAGYVALTDVAPSLLDHFDVDQPDSMSGTLISSADDATVDESLFADFATANEESIFRNEVVGPVSVVFVVAQILAYALAAVAVARRSRWIRPVSYLALVILATPPVAFLAGLLHVHDGTVLTYLLGIFGAAVVLAAIAEGLAVLAGRRWPRTRAFLAPLGLIGLTWLVLAVDILTGGELQIDTVFGYSPIVAGRFAGFGNLAFALVAMSAVVLACGAWATSRLAREPADGMARARGRTVVAMVGFLAVTVVLIGAPMWGSDVGGVLAAVPSFAVLVLVAAGLRVGWRRGALIVAGTAVALSAFAAIDLARPEEDRTHLGRLVDRVVGSDGSGGFGEVLQRKINSNVSILTSSVWTWTIPAALGLMVFLARRRSGFLRDLQEQVPGIRATLAGGLLVAFLGFALNDSGVAVPAMMFAILLPFLTYVLLRWDPARP
ncbi:MAG: hypothetical protein U5K30_14870 [Acidimicrobiales bacterium]|nr:hypothetical protein [Acidimicrobiales bacterium]